jgi:hypothetical protein
MSTAKISAMENEPRNLTIGTLIRVAHALGSRMETKSVRSKGKSQNTQPLKRRLRPLAATGSFYRRFDTRHGGIDF